MGSSFLIKGEQKSPDERQTQKEKGDRIAADRDKRTNGENPKKGSSK